MSAPGFALGFGVGFLAGCAVTAALVGLALWGVLLLGKVVAAWIISGRWSP